MSQLLYAVVNPIVKGILRSPLHGLMSRNTIVLEFEGRKSGKSFSTPVSYHETDGQLHCFSDRRFKWWRNLMSGPTIAITLRGRKVLGKPSVVADGSPRMQAALRDFLIAVPRDAPHSGVTMDSEGRPSVSDIERASQNLVMISIEVVDVGA